MKFGVVVFPGSNCDEDMQDALSADLEQEVIMLWHKSEPERFTKEDCIVLPGGFSYGDYLRCGAIARFSPIMQKIIEFANDGGRFLAFVTASRYYVNRGYCRELYCEMINKSLFAKIYI